MSTTLPEFIRAVADRIEAAEKKEVVRLMKVLRDTLDEKIKEHEK